MSNIQKSTNSLTPEQIALIKRTVAVNTTDDELAMFLHIARKYDLDPLMKEIWCIKYRDKVSIFVSRDGYLKIAHQSGVFDGMTSYTIDDENGNPVKAVCEVYRKDMSRPFRAEVKFKEYYNPNNPIHVKYPSAIIIKVAEVFALRRAFSISGVTSEYEVDVASIKETQASEVSEQYVMSDFEREKVVSIVSRFHKARREKALLMLNKLTRSQVANLLANPPFINEVQKSELRQVMKENGISEAVISAYLKETYDIDNVDDITTDIYNDVVQDVVNIGKMYAGEDIDDGEGEVSD